MNAGCPSLSMLNFLKAVFSDMGGLIQTERIFYPVGFQSTAAHITLWRTQRGRNVACPKTLSKNHGFNASGPRSLEKAHCFRQGLEVELVAHAVVNLID
jgi:hypothetical protein